jgi:AraC-like DNA-binding protein
MLYLRREEYKVPQANVGGFRSKRSKAERIQALIKEVRDAGNQPPKRLAEKLGVSERTVYRYLRLLESTNLLPASYIRRQSLHPSFEQQELIKAITRVAETMPPIRVRQLYEFALFLQTHPLPTEETLADIEADEAVWEAQFAATDTDKLARLVASVEKEIAESGTLPMFDERGEFVEHE